MPRVNKISKLNELTSDYMQSVADLFPKDEQLVKVMDDIPLTSQEKKLVKNLDLDLLSQAIIASILGYL